MCAKNTQPTSGLLNFFASKIVFSHFAILTPPDAHSRLNLTKTRCCVGVVHKNCYIRLELFKITFTMKDKILRLAIGGSGITAVGMTTSIDAISPETITTTGNLIIQVIIAIVTIFGLFKKKSE